MIGDPARDRPVPAAGAPARNRVVSSEFILVSGIVAVACVVRFAALGVKSYWHDEGLTIGLLHLGFGQIFHALHTTEPDPPLYFAVAWVWARVFGYGEFALRSLSAVAGVLTVPVTYLAGRRLVGPRGALLAAALLAVNPLLVWYSQEARTYALFGLFGALSLLALVYALDQPSAKTVAAWAASCALMLATHYFAVFLILPEAAWLVWSARGKSPFPLLLGVGALPAIGISIALAESASKPASSVNYGGLSTFPERVIGVPGALAAGFESPQRKIFALISALLVLLAFGLLLRFGSARQRHGALVAGSLGAATLALPVAAAVVGQDYINARNVIEAMPALGIVVGAGLGVTAGDRLGAAAASGVVATAVLAAIGLTAVISTASTPKYHYQDWRAVAAAMGPAPAARAVVVNPPLGPPALAVYLPRGLDPLTGLSPPVSEVDVVIGVVLRDGQTSDPLPPRPSARPVPPAPGFRLREVDRQRRFTLMRFVSRTPRAVTPGIRRAAMFAGPHAEALIEPGPR